MIDRSPVSDGREFPRGGRDLYPAILCFSVMVMVDGGFTLSGNGTGTGVCLFLGGGGGRRGGTNKYDVLFSACS